MKPISFPFDLEALREKADIIETLQAQIMDLDLHRKELDEEFVSLRKHLSCCPPGHSSSTTFRGRVEDWWGRSGKNQIGPGAQNIDFLRKAASRLDGIREETRSLEEEKKKLKLQAESLASEINTILNGWLWPRIEAQIDQLVAVLEPWCESRREAIERCNSLPGVQKHLAILPGTNPHWPVSTALSKLSNLAHLAQITALKT